MNRDDKTAKASTDPLQAWVHGTADIPAGGLSRTRTASETERAAIVKALGLTALDKLDVRYRIVSLPGGGWRLSGDLTTDVVQACVVTLEPVASHLSETFNVEFWRDAGEPEGGEDKSVLSGPDVEALPSDEIPAGRIVFEALSAGLDPYPRSSSAAFDWQDPETASPEKISPFSILAKLKDKS